MISLDFAICTHNEGSCINTLLEPLCQFIESYPPSAGDFGIVIQDDNSTDPATQQVLEKYSKYPFVTVHTRAFGGDFATHKNALTELCTREWILNLDADEFMDEYTLSMIPHIIAENPAIEAYWIPRVNTVDGLTLKHVQQWGWMLSSFDDLRQVKHFGAGVIEPQLAAELELLQKYNLIVWTDTGFVTYKIPVINWPDVQMRLYRNNGKIRWKNKVHEVLHGYETFSRFPLAPEFAIKHYKDIQRQERQNQLYDSMGQ